MFKQWLKQFVCVLVCLITLLSPMSEVAHAKDYVSSDSSGGSTYYIIEGKDVKKLFDFSLGDVPDILSWILEFKTYTVIKDYTDSDGNQVKKGYFNTPNLQSLVKNMVISGISDGYTDDTYDVNETEKIVSVGENAENENAITKYGFAIPSYTYMGEYPKEIMSPAGIVPNTKSWWEVLWTAIKALFGVSFIKAPTADNFNTIKYLNHTYIDSSDYILQFMKDYYLLYFEKQVPINTAYDLEDKKMKEYFDSPEMVMALTVSEDANKDAESYCEKYSEEYEAALQHYAWWYRYTSNGSTVGLCGTNWLNSYSGNGGQSTLVNSAGGTISGWNNKWDKITSDLVLLPSEVYGNAEDHRFDSFHYLASRYKYKNAFLSWVQSNPKTAYVIANSIPDSVSRKPDDGSTTYTNAASYTLSTSGLADPGNDDVTLICLAADMVRYYYDYIMTHLNYEKQKSTGTRTLVKEEVTESASATIYYKVKCNNSFADRTDSITIDNYYVGSDLTFTKPSSTVISKDYPDDASAPEFTYGTWTKVSDENRDQLYKDVEAKGVLSPGYTEDAGQGTVTEGAEYDAGSTTRTAAEHDTKNLSIEFKGSNPTINFTDGTTYKIPFVSDSAWTASGPGKVRSIEVTRIVSNKTETATQKKKEQTVEKYRYANFKFESLWDGRGKYADAKNKITNLSDFTDGFQKQFDFERYGGMSFNMDDMVHPDLQAIYKNYEQNVVLQANFDLFNKYMARGVYNNSSPDSQELKDLDWIPYRQCMIQNTGEEGECKSNAHGDGTTTLTAANIIVYSDVYQITEKYRANGYSGDYSTLSDQDAHAILQRLQSYCGPYYQEVLSNMFKLMAASAKKEGVSGPTTRIVDDDPRSMPYDTGSMLRADKENYAVAVDPRVGIYKDHIIGGIVSDFALSGGIGIYIKPQKVIISLAGRITELSVFIQSLCNFDFMDEIGLSPANMWSHVFTTLLMVALVLYFIIKTVVAVIKMGTKGSSSILIGFLILVLELGIVTCFAVNPEGTWKKIKDINKTVMNLGEMTTIANREELKYLFGNGKDYEVAYYIPYLDCWAKFNTGYGMLNDEQIIDETTDSKELTKFVNPQIAGNDIRHWAVILADSFEYHGRSNALTGTILYTDKNGNQWIANGENINSNAYRVVDHFMAPRIEFLPSETDSSKLTIDAKKNENYNGEFQTGFGDILVKLANCCLGCFLSIIKLMIFIFYWWQLYSFIFNVVLGLGAERKKMSDVVLETFTPLLCLVLWGLYSGLCLYIGMTMEGFIGFCIIFFMFWLTTKIILWWHDFARGRKLFPFTLGWLYMLLNMSKTNRVRQQQQLEDESMHDAQDAGIDFTEEENEDFSLKTKKLFDENGNLSADYAGRFKNDEKVQKVYENWYKHAQYKKQHYGYNFSPEEYAAVKNYESNSISADRAKKIRTNIENGDHPDKSEDKPNNETNNTENANKSSKTKSNGKINSKEDADDED